jgi:hypothetical protein
MNNDTLKTLQQNFKSWLAIHFIDDEFGDLDRSEALDKLTEILNVSGVSLPEHGVQSGKFINDGQLHIYCGPKDKYGNEKWEIVLWLDGEVEPTTYDENLGGLYDGTQINIFKVIDNPQLIIDNLKDLIENYQRDVQDMIDEGEYDYSRL